MPPARVAALAKSGPNCELYVITCRFNCSKDGIRFERAHKIERMRGRISPKFPIARLFEGAQGKQRVKKSFWDTSLPRMILGFCNPLIDAVENVDRSYLQKWHLKNDDAILADESYQPLIDEIVHSKTSFMTAGGTAQNTLVMAQWMLQDNGKTAMCGAVGNDGNRKLLESIMNKCNVQCLYQEIPGKYTGCCAILVCDNNRSIVASVAASSCFDFARWDTPEVMNAFSSAKAVFLTTFFMRSSALTSLAILSECLYRNIPLALNLSSPTAIESEAWPTLREAFRVATIIFGNQTESVCIGKKLGILENSVSESSVDCVKLSKELANFGKPTKKRLIIITMADQPAIACENGSEPIRRAVKTISPSQIVDTNGAGDSYAGGFLAYYIQGYPVEKCLDAGAYASWCNLQQRGCSLPSYLPSFK